MDSSNGGHVDEAALDDIEDPPAPGEEAPESGAGRVVGIGALIVGVLFALATITASAPQLADSFDDGPLAVPFLSGPQRERSEVIDASTSGRSVDGELEVTAAETDAGVPEAVALVDDEVSGEQALVGEPVEAPEVSNELAESKDEIDDDEDGRGSDTATDPTAGTASAVTTSPVTPTTVALTTTTVQTSPITVASPTTTTRTPLTTIAPTQTTLSPTDTRQSITVPTFGVTTTTVRVRTPFSDSNLPTLTTPTTTALTACDRIVAGGTTLPGADLRGCDFSSMSIDGLNLSNAQLDDANLSNVVLTNFNLDGASLDGAQLNGAQLQDGTLAGASFNGADLSEASLSDLNLTGVEFVDAFVGRLQLGGANLTSANFGSATGLPLGANSAVFGETTCPDQIVRDTNCWVRLPTLTANFTDGN